uniref:MORN repeat-containing protein 3 n=1 Tax=Haptolina ericina TaxID=156174 RepID=A0A7S3BCK0_9EUKA
MGTVGRDKLAAKEGERKTVFFSKKLATGGYVRTGQYLGEWKENKYDGKGTLESDDGTRYVGEWRAGKRNGMGTLWIRRADGKLYKQYAGQWKDDLQDGRGVQTIDGETYNGEWSKGVRHGVGICHYAAGGVYEGEWFNDQRHGFGVFDYVNGDHFEGGWVEDKKEGEGVHFYFNKEKRVHTKRYDGEWVDDLPKCGVYTEMPPDPQVDDSKLPEPLPVTQLRDPDGIIRSRIEQIREDRSRHRATRIPLDEHFTSEELEALQVAFARVDTEDRGEIPHEEMGAAFSQVGMDPSQEDIAAVLAHLGKDADPSPTFTFAEFAQAADFLSPVS